MKKKTWLFVISTIAVVVVIAMVSMVKILAEPNGGVNPALAADSTVPSGDSPSAGHGSVVITVAAVGDIMMGSTYPTPILPPDGGASLFGPLSAELRSADILIGNLEGPLANGGTCTKTLAAGRSYAFRTPTAYVKHLVDAGFDVLNFANNHYADFGATGLSETRHTLDSAGLKITGPIGDVATLAVKGKKISVIGFSPHPGTYNMLDIPGAQKLVAELKRKSDIVIVTFHGGSEGTQALHTRDAEENLFGNPRGNVVRFSHAVIDSGADLVAGHGPHVPRALELYRDRLIGYSLGNFCTYAGMSVVGECGLTLILKADLDSTGAFVSGRIVPAYQPPPGGPRPDTTGRALRLIQNLTRADFPDTGPDIGDDGVIRKK